MAVKLGQQVVIRWPDGVLTPAVVTRTYETTIPSSFDKLKEIRMFVGDDRWGHTPTLKLAVDQCDLLCFGVLGAYPLFGVRKDDGIGEQSDFTWRLADE
jgi:hypothetical protein